jgi:hypothetical protein
MKLFVPKDPPPNFHETTTIPGERWLMRNPDTRKRPRDYWSVHRDYLAECFNNWCGYAIMRMGKCTVDHYLSCVNNRTRAYQWENYRYVCNSINSSKKKLDTEVLDPFEIEHDWFIVQIPSFLLIIDKVPAEQQQRAERTVNSLNLSKGFAAYRHAFYRDFLQGNASIKTLRSYAPLLAAALDVLLHDMEKTIPFAHDADFQSFLQGETMLTGLHPAKQHLIREMLPPADPPARIPLRKSRSGSKRK